MPTAIDPYQPALTRWASFWRYVGAAAISAAIWPAYLQARTGSLEYALLLDIVAGLISFALLPWRRRLPITIGVATGLLAGLSPLAAGPATLAAVSVATSRRWRAVIIVGIAQIAGAEALLIHQPLEGDTTSRVINSAINVVVISACMGWGLYIGSRRELLWTLRDRAERAEAEQELRASKARGDERSRIAREMHDVLAHRISQVSMHAGALAFRQDLSAEQMRSSASVVQEQANLALTDLRAVLGVLRDQETGELLGRPQPTYADIEGLIDESRRAGVHVEYDAHVADPGSIPERAGRALYRVVQEGLTNARKHAAGATVFVRVSGDCGQGIDVVVRNPLGFARSSAAPGSQLGLIGLAERLDLIGGRLKHRRDASMFVLHGWIPWVP